jgi:hypothetical protein
LSPIAQSRSDQQALALPCLQTPDTHSPAPLPSPSVVQQACPAGTQRPGASRPEQSAAHPHTNAPEQISFVAQASSRQQKSGLGCSQMVFTQIPGAHWLSLVQQAGGVGVVMDICQRSATHWPT